jgi:hypothetical protein
LNAFADRGLKGMRIELPMLFVDAAMTRDEAILSTALRRYVPDWIAIECDILFFALAAMQM